jgi:hypothetical protein
MGAADEGRHDCHVLEFTKPRKTPAIGRLLVDETGGGRLRTTNCRVPRCSRRQARCAAVGRYGAVPVHSAHRDKGLFQVTQEPSQASILIWNVPQTMWI